MTAPTRTDFASLGVHPSLCQVLERGGISAPFPIQSATLPDACAGRDVCGKAPTGSGKTLAFGLAVLTRLAAEGQGRNAAAAGPRALILVPTRELAAQIESDLRPLANAVGARLATIYGGVGYERQLQALRRGVDIVIACPGRLEDLLARRAANLSRVRMVVVDEADRMADMGFLPAVRRLVGQTDATRQMLLFSATLDGPVDQLVRDFLHNPVRHVVASAKEDRGEVHHHFWHAAAGDRVAITAATVEARGPAIVFCRTKRGADRLSDRLARTGLRSAPIHGDRSQKQRDHALSSFRAGQLDVLVATDVAARGIHVDDVALVVHFDPPADATDYVHRAGRTGRAGADGIVVSLLAQEHLGDARRMQRSLGLPNTISQPNVAALAVLSVVQEPRHLSARRESVAPVAIPAPRATGQHAASRHASRRRGRAATRR